MCRLKVFIINCNFCQRWVTSTNGPINVISIITLWNSAHIKALNSVLNIIHSDFIHALSSIRSTISIKANFTVKVIGHFLVLIIRIIIIQIVRGLHLIHVITVHMEWVVTNGEDIFTTKTLNSITHFLWQYQTMINPGYFNWHLLVINWVGTASVAETNINTRNIMIKEIFTVSILQAQHIRIFNINALFSAFWRITLNLDWCVIRKYRLVYWDVHSNKGHKIRNNRRIEIDLELHLGCIIGVCNKCLRIISSWEVTTNESAEYKFWLEGLEKVKLIIFSNLSKLNNFISSSSIFFLALINILFKHGLSIKCLSDWCLSSNQTGNIWISWNLRQYIK